MLFGANRDRNRHRIGLQAIDHHLHHAEKVRAGAVHLVDEGQPRNVVFIRLPPDGFRLRLHAADGVVNHHRAVQYAHRTFHFDGEIHVPGGIDDVYPVRLKAAVHAGPEAAHRRRGNGDPALLLLRHPVGGCRAIVYFPQLVAHPGIKQDTLGGGGFAGIDMRGDTDVAITFEGDGSGHDASLVIVTVNRRPELAAVHITASIIVQLYEYIRTIFAIVTIGEAATTRVALEKQFRYITGQPPIRAAARKAAQPPTQE